MKKTSYVIFILLMIGTLYQDIYAQSGKIIGKVIEAGTNEPLVGATVSIQGTTRGVLVDIDGNYILINVPPGTYTLEARFIGFAVQVFENVVVRTDLTTESKILNFVKKFTRGRDCCSSRTSGYNKRFNSIRVES